MLTFPAQRGFCLCSHMCMPPYISVLLTIDTNGLWVAGTSSEQRHLTGCKNPYVLPANQWWVYGGEQPRCPDAHLPTGQVLEPALGAFCSPLHPFHALTAPMQASRSSSENCFEKCTLFSGKKFSAIFIGVRSKEQYRVRKQAYLISINHVSPPFPGMHCQNLDTQRQT